VSTSQKSRIDRAAIVTGAGRGIGASVARRLASDGFRVLVTDLDGGTAEEVAATIRAAGGEAVAMAADVTAASDRAAMVERARQEWGRVDVLVNNAGIYEAAPPLEVEEAAWERVFRVNTQALFFSCQAALPTMIEQGYGRIVNFSSSAARIGNNTMIAYNASKLAVIAITRNLALEFAFAGVNVNCVLPGIVDTPMWESLNQEVGPLLGFPAGEMMQDRVGKIPLARAGTGDDVAGVVSFLVSDDAGYMTGQAINVTGGLLTA
jgi:NAD(P)-dependent dehydrogenase (short-subunit alcohol dehydrogenase family)